MAVIIQQTVGQSYNGRLYPVVSGVAQSYNFYPISHMEPEDGIVQLALGLGILIAEGAQTYRFSPKYPQMNPPYSSAGEFLQKSQSYFYALNLGEKKAQVSQDEKSNLLKLDLPAAEEDGSLFFVASTYSGAEDTIRDTLSIAGPRVVTFANILKYNVFPLAEVTGEILQIGRRAFGCHIEVEFALNLFKDKERKPEFFLLQIRPMVTGREKVEISLENTNPGDIFCLSGHSMGNGIFNDLYDVVYVDPRLFDPARSREIAEEIGKINRKLAAEEREYILIGFGRWGTSDPWLGIPVEWYHISQARVFIESNLENFNIEPSLGSHFFHNMISLKMGYLHIKKTTEQEFILWDWLKEQEVFNQTKYVKHVRFSEPLTARINARTSKGMILKPCGAGSL